jgi:hypothetical protein
MKCIVKNPYRKLYVVARGDRITGSENTLKDAIKVAKNEVQKYPYRFVHILKSEKDVYCPKMEKVI